MELLVQVRILAGQFRRSLLAAAFLMGASFGEVLRPCPTAAQLGTHAPARDSTELHRAARSAQARFERERVRRLPRAVVQGGGSCDERVGRFCSWYDEGDWAPTPDDPRTGRARDDLVALLDSVARLLPGDRWVAGQRVWYRFEGGIRKGGLAAARSCGAERWWCLALRGLALHGLERWTESRVTFDSALTAMEPRERRAWRFPLRAVDGPGRELLDDLAAEATTDPFRSPRDGARDDPPLLVRFWLLADPLWLVPGNDRRTAHYARWTASLLRVGARTPYGLSWGPDLEELTVRHGWELGWEQGWPRPGFETDVVGHKHPEGRDYFPPGSALENPGAATPEELEPGRTRPRSLYAPPYAPVLLPMDGQLAVFPRGDSVAVVATHFLPPDTSRRRSRDHARPWLEAGDQAGLADQAGLFLAHMGPSAPTLHASVRSPPPQTGGLVVQVPAGEWMVSVERWSPPARRAGRLRAGLSRDTVPPDVATLSDLLLVGPGDDEPGTLEALAATALPRAAVRPGDPLGVGWEVGGIGWRPATLRYTLAVRRTGGSFLARAGRWLGLVGEEDAIRLSWDEAGPDAPERVLRRVELATDELDEGGWEIELELRLPGRGVLRRRLPFTVDAAENPVTR